VDTRRALAPLLLLVLAAAARADGPAPRPPVAERVLLASVETDPAGEASRLAREATAAAADGDMQGAWARLRRLASEYGDVLLPGTALGEALGGGGDPALRRPARRLVNRAVARLPQAWRERADRAWAPAVAALLLRARGGSREALRSLADDYGATGAGSVALLALATLHAEAGRHVAAARRLETWLALNPDAARARRAGVALRLVDALACVGDAGGLETAGLAFRELRDVPVHAGGEATTLADRLADARRSVDRPRPAPPAAGAALPEGLRVLWSRSLRDPHLLRQGVTSQALSGPLPVQAGAWAAHGVLVVDEGRVVRRLDPATGLERWRFPRGPRPTLQDPIERYQGHDLPWRTVTPAGDDAVLVVLGNPAASGRTRFLGSEYSVEDLGRECRPRLVCLDLAAGRPRWVTGAVDETDPVLGDLRTGCCSPPLVVGHDVYALFARRSGATTFFLARLDLATGRPRWVARLAAGDSGRDPDEGRGGRFVSDHVQSVPWGERPALAGGEVCAVPHAGFAAGVDAGSGRVRWVRALPRYGLDDEVPATVGQSNHNAPLAWGDAWIVAPMDGPRLLCLARGSGVLRWQRGGRTPSEDPPWRDLLDVGPDRHGRPCLRLAGERALRMDPADGALLDARDVRPWDLGVEDAGGRALDLGAWVVRAAGSTLQARAWDPTGRDGRGEVSLGPAGLEDPAGGDVLRADGLWFVVGPDRLTALGPAGGTSGRDPVHPAAGAPGLDAAGRAAALGRRAALQVDLTSLEKAVEGLAEVHDAALAARATARVRADGLALLAALRDGQDEIPRLEALAKLARRLPAGQEGAWVRPAAARLLALGADEAAARLLVRVVEAGDDALRPVPGDDPAAPPVTVRVRGDLRAAALLRAHAGRPGVARVLAEREQAWDGRVDALLAGGDPGERVLRETARRAVGTRAAERVRRALQARLTRVGRRVEAAAVAADRRLDPPWSGTPGPRPPRVKAAALLQMEESALLGEAGDGLRARTLAADLERWAPGGLRSGRGRTQSVLRAELRARFGWYPQVPGSVAGPASLDVWRGVGTPRSQDELRSVAFLDLRGPGVARLGDTVLLARGLAIEAWSLGSGRRLATLHGPGEGWFGGRLTGVQPGVPGGGILVSSLVAGEPADRSGIIDGDWVRTWDGKPVRDLPDFMQLVASSRPGATFPVGIWRHGRLVLSRFTAGRRPPRQGGLLEYDALWVDAAGRVLVPGRTGLTWVDPRAGTRTPAWTWTGAGVVRRYDMAGGAAYVTVRREPMPDLVVAVDPERGTESWRREVRGRIVWLQPVGSALWVETRDPGQAFVLDAHDGRPRAWFRTFDRRREQFRRCWVPDREAAVACGRGYLVSGGDDAPAFRIVNTTTAAVEAEAADERAAAWARGANPQVAAGAYVARTHGASLRLVFPDPLGGAPRHVVDVDPQVFMAGEMHHGPLDQEARLALRGLTLYLLRIPQQGYRNVNVHVLGVDLEALQRGPRTGTEPSGAVVYDRTNLAWLGGEADPPRYVLDMRPTFEGLLVSSARLGDTDRAETWWVSAGGDDAPPEDRNLRLLWRSLGEAQRAPPARVGARLLVPTDEGARVVPVAGS
jgi:outer membrane protein assembly factor BamB